MNASLSRLIQAFPMKKNKSRLLLAGLALLAASAANAGITLGGTRIVYAQKSKEVSILVKNESPKDIMIQSWLDSGNGDKDQDVPFALTPSLSRLGANKQQLLRVFYFGKGLPADQESVFWLSVQEIPQKAEDDNTLQIAVRQRIKMFYRPNNLSGTPEEAVINLRWRLLTQQGKNYLEVKNGAPYFISLSEIKLVTGVNKHPLVSEMVSPNSTRTFEVPYGIDFSAAKMSVEFSNINDYGAPTIHTSPVMQ